MVHAWTVASLGPGVLSKHILITKCVYIYIYRAIYTNESFFHLVCSAANVGRSRQALIPVHVNPLFGEEARQFCRRLAKRFASIQNGIGK